MTRTGVSRELVHSGSHLLDQPAVIIDTEQYKLSSYVSCWLQSPIEVTDNSDRVEQCKVFAVDESDNIVCMKIILLSPEGGQDVPSCKSENETKSHFLLLSNRSPKRPKSDVFVFVKILYKR